MNIYVTKNVTMKRERCFYVSIYKVFMLSEKTHSDSINRYRYVETSLPLHCHILSQDYTGLIISTNKIFNVKNHQTSF